MAQARIIVALLMRNEADRFLRSALSAWETFASRIVVVDDSSTDESVHIARGHTHVDPLIELGDPTVAWGSEAHARKLLWEYALQEAVAERDWVFVLDADMTPDSGKIATLVRELAVRSPTVGAIAFPMYDLWGHNENGALLYRSDGYWQAHYHPRVWMVKVPKQPKEGWKWVERGIHCGHFPENLPPTRTVICKHSLLHYGYFTPEIRLEKYARYVSVDGILTPFERAHANSILAENPVLDVLPFTPELELEPHLYGGRYAV